MVWKIIVCDDEPTACALVEKHLRQIADELQEEFRISCFSGAEELLAGPVDADILLLDIQMGEMSGMDAARQLRAAGNDVLIIFITSMTQYAIEGYEVHAFGFLPKPIQYAVLKIRISDALFQLKRKQGSMVQIQTTSGTYPVRTSEILYFESYGHDIHVVSKTSSYDRASATMQKYEEQFRPYHFFRCHKSYLINLAQIKAIHTDYVLMNNGASVPISKYRKRDLNNAFAAYQGGLL